MGYTSWNSGLTGVIVSGAGMVRGICRSKTHSMVAVAAISSFVRNDITSLRVKVKVELAVEWCRCRMMVMVQLNRK